MNRSVDMIRTEAARIVSRSTHAFIERYSWGFKNGWSGGVRPFRAFLMDVKSSVPGRCEEFAGESLSEVPLNED